jgi:hypothetical protein
VQARVPFGSFALVRLTADEEEQLVFDDASAEASAVLGLFELGDRRRPVNPSPTYDGSRLVPKSDPSKSFVPERVTAFTPPPVKPLCRTSYGETRSCSSWMASSEIGCVPAPPPGVPDAERPNRSLFTAPSIWMLL